MRRQALGTIAMMVAVLAGCAAANEDALEAEDALSAARDGGADASDAGRDGAVGPGSDGGPAARCNGEVDHVDDLTGSIAASPILPGLALTPDEKTIYFGYDAPRGIVVAERDSITDAFGTITRPRVNVDEAVTYPHVVGDTLLVTVGAGSTSRIARANRFAHPGYLAFEELEADVPLMTPFVDPSTGTLYASRTDGRPYIGTLESGKLLALTSLRTKPIGLPISAPVLSSDGLRIYLTLWTGINGPSRPIIATATRATTSATWSMPKALEGVDRATAIPGWVSPDGCRLYFTEKRADAGWKARVAMLKP